MAVVLNRPLGGVPAGTYTYDIAAHSLVAEPPSVHQAYAGRLGQHDHGFVVRTRVERAMWRYRDLRALRPLLIDAGHLTELVTYLLGRLAVAADVVSAPVASARPAWLQEPEVVTIRAGNGLAAPQAAAGPVFLSSASPPQSVSSPDRGSGYLTNPAMVLRFVPSLSASIIWPTPTSIAIDLTDFLVLNHCLPSTRGDRDPSAKGIMQTVSGASLATIDRLSSAGALLPVSEARRLYDEIRLWVRHEWYLSFLAYLDALGHGLANPASSVVASETGYFADAAALLSRHTSRVFAPDPLRVALVENLLRRVFPTSWWPGTEVSVAVWNVIGLEPGLYRWCDGKLMSLGTAPDRALAAANCAGQTAAAAGALAIWVSVLTDSGRPERYLLDLVDLGRVGQRVCMAATELGIATFLSPAVYDGPTCSMLGIDTEDQRLTYVFGLGVEASNLTACQQA